jgi:hypothetical protein
MQKWSQNANMNEIGYVIDVYVVIGLNEVARMS